MLRALTGEPRSIQITEKIIKGFMVDGFGTMDGNPDRIVFEFEAINCSKAEFLDWFLPTDLAEGLCSDGVRLIDLGSPTLDINVGSIIAVTYNDMIDSWLNWKAAVAKADIADRTFLAKSRISAITQ